jgi:hypothetical protein
MAETAILCHEDANRIKELIDYSIGATDVWVKNVGTPLPANILAHYSGRISA